MDWRGTGEWTWERAIADAHVSRYAAQWGHRAGDGGVLARHDGGAAQGAVWWRLFTADAPGYGFVAEDVPELGLAVSLESRGRGLGPRLLRAAIAHARESGHPALSLSVEDGNEAARRIYESAGFVVMGREGSSDTMVLAL
ncbi:hypothetical protein Dac01nite_23400 [Demequina activiva]|uniref:N-acetyltransferase domain-containing protein n=2 Tax=Demequina activiva TaxID=1582364 RepID=A0A919UMD7_9MICO|nr:hypothetical protein Dac01nite_23400 [Demequina activiva]